MKFFISYGRDISDFVHLVRDELTSRGHSVWIDSSDIERGDDWREKITSGILESDAVLAFMSSYGLRRGGVCIDELAIAVSCGRKTIKTFVMEPDLEDRIPSTVRRIQYYDLSEYAKCTRGADETAPDNTDPDNTTPDNTTLDNSSTAITAVDKDRLAEWFASVKTDLIEYILNTDSGQHDWMDILEARLSPEILRGREIAGLREPFLAREWLDDLIQKWTEQKGDDNIMLLAGFPGFGKSCYCMNFFHYNPYVCSLSLCDWSDSSPEGIARLIRSIAFNLAVHMPSYGKKLLWVTDECSQQIVSMDPERLFSLLITEPLVTEIDGGHHPVLVVIDGLDRLTNGGNNLLAEIIASNVGILPDYVNILISSRNDKAVFRCFNSASKVEFRPESKDVSGDIERFVTSRLRAYIDDGRIDESDIHSLTDRCAGSFLMAKILTDGIIKGTVRKQDLGRLPGQLSDIFFQWMHRIEPDEDAFAEEYYSAFSILAAAEKPVPAALLRECLGWRKPDLMSFLRKFSVILIEDKDETGTAISLFNQAFASWISDENGNADVYLVDPEEGLDLICSGYMSMYRKGTLPEEEYLDFLSSLKSNYMLKELADVCSSADFAAKVLRYAREGLRSRDVYAERLALLRMYRDSGHSIEAGIFAEISYLIASGCFFFGDLLTAEKELSESADLIRDHLGHEAYMDTLYMLGTSQEWLGKREESIKNFSALYEEASSYSPHALVPAAPVTDDEYLIRALTGLIWNDHFTNAEEGMARLEELRQLQAKTPETELSARLIEARLLLTAGKLQEALDLYRKADALAGDELWGYDSVSVRNQMLMLEILVACYDNERYTEGAELGEKIYSRLQNHYNISECYCASWIAANCLKAGLYGKADKYLDIAESISGGTRKQKSAWISMHLKSIRAFLDGETGRTEAAQEGHLAVIDMARATSDDWVLGDACFEYLQLSLMTGRIDGPRFNSAVSELEQIANKSGLAHLLFKSRIIKMVLCYEEPDCEFIIANLDADYPSTDMIQILYLLYRFIEEPAKKTADLRPADVHGADLRAPVMKAQIRAAIIRKVRDTYALNPTENFAGRPGIRHIMEELGFELHD